VVQEEKKPRRQQRGGNAGKGAADSEMRTSERKLSSSMKRFWQAGMELLTRIDVPRIGGSLPGGGEWEGDLIQKLAGR